MSINKIKKEAMNAISSIENGREFPSSYVVSRLDKAWDLHQKDQVIGNIRSVLTKVASKSNYISQKDITKIYDRFSNISGGNTSFREELGDLLMPGYGQVSGPIKADISKTAADMGKPVSLSGQKSELSDAFSVLFSMGSEQIGTYNKNLVKKAERLVSLELNSIGLNPDLIQTVTGNEHYILCNAYYRNPDFTTSHVSIPVQISNGSIELPTQMINDGSLVKLNKENILVSLKTASKSKKESNVNKYSGMRQESAVNLPRVNVPKPLKEEFSMSEEVVLAASKYSPEQIKIATSMLAIESSDWGCNTQIKFAGINDRGMSFLMKVATSKGNQELIVPVEVKDSRINIPSTFISKDSKKEYDFSRTGFYSFASDNLVQPEKTGVFYRERDELVRLSYNQLMDVVIDGVSKKDFKASEDAISAIADKFGPEKQKIALEEFQKLLKVASTHNNNESLIKEAVRRGDLIKKSNSIELYSPRFGLPLSKLEFDEKGRLMPKYRKAQNDMSSIDGTILSSSKIVMS